MQSAASHSLSPPYYPLVSVVIPTYNRCHFIADCIDSVLGQTYANIEVLVVDDGSTDATAQVLAGYADRVKIIRQKNAGQAAARNNGIKNSRGELIAFLDDDDSWRPTKLELQVPQFENPDIFCVHAGIMYRHEQSEKDFELHRDRAVDLHATLAGVILPIQTVVVRRSAFETAGLFAEDLRGPEDWDMFIRLAVLGPSIGIGDCVADVRVLPGSSGKQVAAMFKQIMRMLHKHGNYHGDCEECRKAILLARMGWRAVSYQASKEQAGAAWRQKKYGTAIKKRLQCFYFHPSAVYMAPIYKLRKLLKKSTS